jgi:hypothetical protein
LIFFEALLYLLSFFVFNIPISVYFNIPISEFIEGSALPVITTKAIFEEVYLQDGFLLAFKTLFFA